MYTGKNPIRVALWVLGNKTKKVKGKILTQKSQPSILWVPLKGAHTYITDGPKNGGENFCCIFAFYTSSEYQNTI